MALAASPTPVAPFPSPWRSPPIPATVSLTPADFTNPSGMVTEVILRHSRIKAVGLCNVP